MNKVLAALAAFYIIAHPLSADIPVLPVEESLAHIITHTLDISLDDIMSQEMVAKYIKRCRKKLKLLDYCIRNSHPVECSDYLRLFLFYHEINLFYFINPNEFNSQRLEEYKIRLFQQIALVKKIFNMKELDVTEELNNTWSLCNQLNSEYYNSLGILQKLQFSRSIKLWSSFQENIHRTCRESN